jgi:hypothetical protein
MALYTLTRDVAGLEAGAVVCVLTPASARKPGEPEIAEGASRALDSGRVAAWLEDGTLAAVPDPIAPLPAAELSKGKRGKA